jgi:hypothetical protein
MPEHMNVNILIFNNYHEDDVLHNKVKISDRHDEINL